YESCYVRNAHNYCAKRAPSPSSRRTSPQSTQATATAVPRVPEPQVRVKRAHRGIVTCLHDKIVPLGASLVRELRCLGNDEPIEVYHCSELAPTSVALLHAIDDNIRVIDVCQQLVKSGAMDVKLARSFRSYWIKPLAIHQSALEEIILLDADDVLMRDPAVLRATPGYQVHGTLFFYDRVVRRTAFFNRQHKTPDGKPQGRFLPHWLRTFDYARFNLTHAPSPRLLDSLAYHGTTCHEQDSSLLLVNKRGAATAMAVLWFLITEERFRHKFSWGDKEAFWLAYEFSHTPYFFSPWGASVVSSTSNDDMTLHPDTLCGSLAHYLPLDDGSAPELLYVNGKALVDPVPFNARNTKKLRANQVFNMLPTHVVPRQVRASVARPEQGREYLECLTGLGAVPVPPALHARLWRRRLHFMALSMNLLEPLRSCGGADDPLIETRR
ncbi:hypothetical protein PybrP1_000817, partial [[Pythium] brassicae (nom. inval.)]